MPTIDRPGAMIFWDERGEGDAVLLVHGGLFDPMTGERFWITPGVADDLATAGYRVLTPDRRFSPGRTTAGFAAHSWDVEADDMVAVLDAAGVERAHLVGGSSGCSVIARLALRHPERVATLVLCWPGVSTTIASLASFERSAVAVEHDGTAAYLDRLRRDDVPRPGEERPGFPYGFALLHDRRTANSFLAHSGADAARIIRETAAAMIPGDPIRGLTREDAARLGSSGIPIHVMPAEPEDPYHLRANAFALRDAIPGASLTAGFPVTPSRFFPDVHESFAMELQRVMRIDSHIA
jgi:pimeloyl-ACP methyl ester carboxylesterase